MGGNDMKKLPLKQGWRYFETFVLGLGVAVLLTFFFNYFLGWSLPISSNCAVVIAWFLKFALHKWWVYESGDLRKTPKQVFWYICALIAPLIPFNALEYFLRTYYSYSELKSNLVAGGVTIFVVGIARFFLFQRVFRK